MMKKQIMTIMITFVSISILAEPRWYGEYSNGQVKYTARQSDNTYWLISCDVHEYKDPYIKLVVNGKEVKPYDIVVDGITYSKPYWRISQRNDGNMYNMWWALRKGKDIKAKVGNKFYPLPSKGSAKTLPSELDKTNYCIPSF